jgi:ribonuclease HepT-like protein
MADYQEKIKAELEQVAQAIAKLPSCPLSELNELELSGVGGILQSFYNGIENILKQTFLANGKAIPEDTQWHRQIIQQAVEHGFISEKTMDMLIPYLTFRHLYRNAYVLDLRPDRMQILMDTIKITFCEFENEIV